MNVAVLVDIFLSLPSNLCLCHRMPLEMSGCVRDNILQGTIIQKTINWDKGPNLFCELSSA